MTDTSTYEEARAALLAVIAQIDEAERKYAELRRDLSATEPATAAH